MASFSRQLTKLRKSPPNQHNKNPSENPSTDLSAWFLITCGICANNQKEIDKYPLSSDRFARNFTVSPERAPCLNISAACSISVCAVRPDHPLARSPTHQPALSALSAPLSTIMRQKSPNHKTESQKASIAGVR